MYTIQFKITRSVRNLKVFGRSLILIKAVFIYIFICIYSMYLLYLLNNILLQFKTTIVYFYIF